MMTMTITTTSIPRSGHQGDRTQRRAPENRAPEPRLRKARDPRLRLVEEDLEQRLKQVQGNLDQDLVLETTHLNDRGPGAQVQEDLDPVLMEQKRTDKVPGSQTTETMEEQKDLFLGELDRERQKPEHLGRTLDELAQVERVPIEMTELDPEDLVLVELDPEGLDLVELDLAKDLTVKLTRMNNHR